jgi:NTP pyrophosphatase (non-canonical NTP hydrolase)
MEMKELLKFIDFEDDRLDKYYGIPHDKKILARTVKLAEELGELCNEVLAHSALLPKHKLDNHDKENIREEFADVIITTLLLAKSMGIDIENALERKMEKIEKKRDV